MPGDVYLTDSDYAAGLGYGGYAPTGALQTQQTGGSWGGQSHTSFIVWLIVFSVGSVVIMHGLRLGGFTFVFKR